ncbi:hypothetical protein FSP39_012573 [Pinctada imbricata]|uniref:[histone H3]-lysine(4) N-trimethyltransferase n=1 Tax=Pinctada imbricata TaxID=66713 RepID=A0AA89BJ99_PINIB|nr:hypothetical protein FSP39_012573 [Pinctada imbricata]
MSSNPDNIPPANPMLTFSDVQEMKDKKQQDDDEMSISSGNSGDQNIEVNPPLITNQPGLLNPPNNANFINPWQAPGISNIYGTSGNCGNFNFMGNPNDMSMYGQNLYNSYHQMVQNQINEQMEKENKALEKKFISVLNSFVEELKDVMQKDLCKKMVQNSAFKSFDTWWTQESEYQKQQAMRRLLPERVPEKPTTRPTTVTVGKSEVTSTLASLFEPQHPWSKDGEMNLSGFGGMGFGGGFLGIRGGMPRLPSFKKKTYRPPSPIIHDEESKMSGTKEEMEESERDSKVKRPSRIKKPVVSESEDEDDDDSDDSDEEEEDDEEEGEESSEEDSDEEEDEETSEAEEDEEEEEASSEEEGEEKEEAKEKVTEEKAKKKVKVDEKTVKRVEKEDDESVNVNVEEDDDEEEGEIKDDKEDDKEDEEMEEIDVEERPEEKEIEKEKVHKEKETPVQITPTKEICDNKLKTDTQKVTKETEKDQTSAISTSAEPIGTQTTPSGFETLLQASEILSLRELTQKPPISPQKGKGKENKKLDTLIKAAKKDIGRTEVEKDAEKPRFLAEHDYFAPPSLLPKVDAMTQDNDTDGTMSAEEDAQTTPYEVFMDHNYCLPPRPADIKEIMEEKKKERLNVFEEFAKPVAPVEVKKPEKPKREYKKRKAPLKESTNLNLNDIANKTKGSRELINLLPPPKPITKFPQRKFDEERCVFFDMYSNGIDDEDIRYLKRTYEHLLESDDPMGYWINDILWVDHPVTNIPDPVVPKKRRKMEPEYPKPHKTGSARTEGYYKLTSKVHSNRPNEKVEEENQKDIGRIAEKKAAQSSREARHENRRLQVSVQDLEFADLFKFNQLRLRKKQLKFARSGIHDWGLFALEPIASDEMVIEYVGESIRQSIADLREKKYEAEGCGSSYLFRVDTENIIDATKVGNLARFINHSCNPNCYAKIIPLENQKKIVIYSKRDIDVNEEITYDYKFPIEDEKIPCLCGAPNCRGTLN